MKLPGVLDHIVINTRFDMDRAEDIFVQLGFTLTPRGRHSLGSTNYLMMFSEDYLELLGIPEAEGDKRPDVSGAPAGLNGLVFKTDDADEAYRRLEKFNMAGDPPRSFARPLVLSDGTHQEARFRTVTASADAFPAGRLYFCEHLTPELLWRGEWQTHANGVTGFTELVIVHPHPVEHAELLAGLLGHSVEGSGKDQQEIVFKDAFRLIVLSREAYGKRFGALACDGEGRDIFIGAVGLRCASPDKLDALLEDLADQTSVARKENGVDVTIGAFDTLLRFEF